MYEWSGCINMLLVIDTLRRAASQLSFSPLFLLPAAELEMSPSISRLMNAAARSASSLTSSSSHNPNCVEKCTGTSRCKHDMWGLSSILEAHESTWGCRRGCAADYKILQLVNPSDGKLDWSFFSANSYALQTSMSGLAKWLSKQFVCTLIDPVSKTCHWGG